MASLWCIQYVAGETIQGLQQGIQSSMGTEEGLWGLVLHCERTDKLYISYLIHRHDNTQNTFVYVQY